jgi:hypothetical protein
MRYASFFLPIAIIAVSIPSFACAQEESYQLTRINARRDLEVAVMELRNYLQVEYPRKQRHLNAAIELTEAEIRDLKEQLREYGPFSRFSTGQPLLITVQNAWMCLRDAELRLRDLWAERNALMRFHSDQWRLLEWKVFDARLRVAEIEAEMEGPAVSSSSAERPAI